MRDSLLVIIPAGPELEQVRAALGADYPLLIAEDWAGGLALMHEKRMEIAAVLLDLKLMQRENCVPADLLAGSDPFSVLPVIGVSEGGSCEENLECLECGIFDIVMAQTPRQLMLRRIQNAIRATDSVSFGGIEKLLKALPSNIFLKDAEDRYVFATHYWHHLHHADEPGWSIRGKTDLEIRKDRNNALKAMEADRRILATGEGTEYIIEEKEDGTDEFLELIKRPVFDEDGKVTGIIALINDVTEQELLKMELEKRAQVDSLTELLNKATTEELICMRLTAGRRLGKHGALLMIDVDNFKRINDSFGHRTGDRVLSEIGRVIRNSFRGADVAGRVGGDEFMVYIQDAPAPEAVHAIAERIEEMVVQGFEEEHMKKSITLSVGISLFPQHGESFEELYRAADAALYEVKKSGKAACKIYGA